MISKHLLTTIIMACFNLKSYCSDGNGFRHPGADNPAAAGPAEEIDYTGASLNLNNH